MPFYDFHCLTCGSIFEKLVKHGDLPTCVCGGETEKIWTSCPSVHGDDVPGGFTVNNLDSRPRTFYSKSAYRDELRARGLRIRDRHVGEPGAGSDKAPLMRDPHTGRMTRPTSRWI